jgi:nitrate/nitrite transporter NarK
MLFCGPFVGKIFDDYGPRSLLSIGTFLHVFGLMMVSISKKYYQILLSQAICSGIGASMVFYPSFTCVSPDSHFAHNVAHSSM